MTPRRLPGLLTKDDRQLCLLYLRSLETYRSGTEVDTQVDGSRGVYGDPLFDALLARFTASVARAVDRPVAPTYSYVRIYPKGSELHPHTDRYECEFTLSVAIGAADTNPWPLMIGPPDTDYETIELEPGDGVVFEGIHTPHWRPPLASEWAVQGFFHFVDSDGQYRGLINDRRPGLGAPASTKPDDGPTNTPSNSVDIEVHSVEGHTVCVAQLPSQAARAHRAGDPSVIESILTDMVTHIPAISEEYTLPISVMPWTSAKNPTAAFVSDETEHWPATLRVQLGDSAIDLPIRSSSLVITPPGSVLTWRDGHVDRTIAPVAASDRRARRDQ